MRPQSISSTTWKATRKLSGWRPSQEFQPATRNLRTRVPSRSPGSQTAGPFSRPSHPQTAAKVRGFSLIASGFTAETDCLLEGTGFEPSVPHRERNESRSETGTVTEATKVRLEVVAPGTDGSNPVPSSSESSANPTLLPVPGSKCREAAAAGAPVDPPSYNFAAPNYRADAAGVPVLFRRAAPPTHHSADLTRRQKRLLHSPVRDAVTPMPIAPTVAPVDAVPAPAASLPHKFDWRRGAEFNRSRLGRGERGGLYLAVYQRGATACSLSSRALLTLCAVPSRPNASSTRLSAGDTGASPWLNWSQPVGFRHAIWPKPSPPRPWRAGQLPSTRPMRKPTQLSGDVVLARRL
jgi:hypothetical protein